MRNTRWLGNSVSLKTAPKGGIGQSIVSVSVVGENVFKDALVFLPLTFVDWCYNICFLKQKITSSSLGLTRNSGGSIGIILELPNCGMQRITTQHNKS